MRWPPAFESFTQHQWRVLLVLMLVNFVNYIDRNIVFPLFPLIRSEFGLTYLQLGALGTAFSLVHGLGTLPLGILADRVSRKKIISYALLFWSGATFLSGLAASFRGLVAARAMVGVGEAAYSPAATAILTATFPQKVRARIQGAFDMAMFVGGALGLALGSIIAASWGWRSAFFLVGVPGLLLGLSVFRLHDTPAADEARVPLRVLLRIPEYVVMLLGGWFAAFAAYAYITWGTEFVHHYKGYGLRETGIRFGALVVIAGAAGVICGAAIADRWRRKAPWGRIATVPIGFLTSAPLIVLALNTSHRQLVFPLFFAGTFFLTWYHGPVTATIHDLTPPQAHATAMGFYYFVVNISAISLAPLVVGAIADRRGLLWGMHAAVAAQVMGALCFLTAGIMIARNHRRPLPEHEIATEPLRELTHA
jgi:MFS transporter, Spinster family, sphingosine-1-phosphate transporter